jgi:hypothetical protein
MRSKSRTNGRRQKRQRLLVPAKSDVELARRKLPMFEPYDTGRLVADAQQSSADGSLDDRIAKAYNKHCRTQLAKLLRALGCDPNDANFWRSGFIKLARIHHNLGGLVHRPARPTQNASSWTPLDEAVLLCGVTALTQLGDSERAAIRYIADSGIFPHHERRPSERLSGQVTQNARRDALWRKFQRLKRDARHRPDPMADALGQSRSTFEVWLSLLENPPPDIALSGDKDVQVKERVRKSPGD